MNNDIKRRELNYLSHHGIQGQKWGKQNGPPYPLKSRRVFCKRKET